MRLEPAVLPAMLFALIAGVSFIMPTSVTEDLATDVDDDSDDIIDDDDPIDDDLADDDDEPDVTYLNDPLNVVLQDGDAADFLEETTYGSHGNDTLVLNGSTSENVDEVFFGDGDDTFEANGTVGTSITIYGEDGDDTIEAETFSLAYGGDGDDNLILTGINVAAHGDAGDDYILVGADSDAYGGEGNDTLEFNGGGEAFDGPSNLYGGAGDDYFLIDTDIERSAEDIADGIDADTPYASYHGGEGADTFALETTLRLQTDDFTSPIVVSASVTQISDFTSGEDVFLLDLGLRDYDEELEIVSSSFVKTNGEDADTPGSGTLTVTYAATADSPEIVYNISFSNSELTEDDIVIVGA